MRYQVKAKQQNSRMCMVCGLMNQFGLHTSFYELDNDELLAIFKPKTEHQGYPDRLHGGIAAAILDETMGRVIMVRDQKLMGCDIRTHDTFQEACAAF